MEDEVHATRCAQTLMAVFTAVVALAILYQDMVVMVRIREKNFYINTLHLFDAKYFITTHSYISGHVFVFIYNVDICRHL